MNYILSTRFNIGIYSGVVIRKGSEVSIDPDVWFMNRFEIFNQFTVTTVKKQTSNDFIWLIHIDPNTPGKHKQILKNKIGGMSNVFLTTTPYLTYDEINIRGDVILAELDSDDFLELTHVECVRQIANKFRSDTPYVIDTGSVFRVTPDFAEMQIIGTSVRRFLNPMAANPCYSFVTSLPIKAGCHYQRGHPKVGKKWQIIGTNLTHGQVVHNLNASVQMLMEDDQFAIINLNRSPKCFQRRYLRRFGLTC